MWDEYKLYCFNFILILQNLDHSLYDANSWNMVYYTIIILWLLSWVFKGLQLINRNEENYINKYVSICLYIHVNICLYLLWVRTYVYHYIPNKYNYVFFKKRLCSCGLPIHISIINVSGKNCWASTAIQSPIVLNQNANSRIFYVKKVSLNVIKPWISSILKTKISQVRWLIIILHLFHFFLFHDHAVEEIRKEASI